LSNLKFSPSELAEFDSAELLSDSEVEDVERPRFLRFGDLEKLDDFEDDFDEDLEGDLDGVLDGVFRFGIFDSNFGCFGFGLEISLDDFRAGTYEISRSTR